MKINIRENTFETNSSSMHSIVLTNDSTETTDEEILDVLKKNKRKFAPAYEECRCVKTTEGSIYLMIGGKSFGSEFALYDSWTDKLLYAIADANSYKDICTISDAVTERIKKIDHPLAKAFKGLIFEYTKVKNDRYISANIFGYDSGVDTGNIDHQSTGCAHDAVHLINRNSKKALSELIFSKKYLVVTDSDGGCYIHENIRDGALSTEKLIAEASHFYPRDKSGHVNYDRDPIPYWSFLKDLLEEEEDE